MKHKHAELMMEYAKDAMESETPWENWEFCTTNNSKWIPLYSHPEWLSTCEYRRKPKTKLIEGFEVPYPETKKPEKGTVYFVPNVSNNSDLSYVYQWSDTSIDDGYLNNGLVYLDEKSAELRAKAMIAQFKE